VSTTSCGRYFQVDLEKGEFSYIFDNKQIRLKVK
jgi:hypothetical protein